MGINMNKVNNTNFTSINEMTSQVLRNQKSTATKDPKDISKLSFDDVLLKKQEAALNTYTKISELKFSKHANERLISRNIDLSTEQIMRLESGARKANEKGIKESLVMVDNLAFIVNIKNNTVITAVNDKDDKVFTNIDGAVIS